MNKRCRQPQLALSDGRGGNFQPVRQGNWVRRNPGASAVIGGLAVVAGLAAWAFNPFRSESTPTIGFHMTLSDCDGHRDTRPQHLGLYEGQQVTLGVGDSALSHTVTLEVEKGSRLRQEAVDKGVTLLTGDGPQPEPGQSPVGMTLVYTLGERAEVTITAHPSPTDPLVTDVAIVKAC